MDSASYLANATIYWGEYVVNRSDIFHRYWLQFPPPSTLVYYVIGICIAAVGLLSVLGNLLVCIALFSSPALRKQKFFTMNVALSDLLSPLLTYHMFVFSSFEGYWIYSADACHFYAVVQGFCGLLSIASMAVIALERYAAIVAPWSKYYNMTYARKISVTIVVWIYCFTVVSPPMYGIGTYKAAGFLNTCCFDYIDRSYATRTFIFSLFILGLGLPMVIIVYCYWYIFKTVKQTKKLRQKRLGKEDKIQLKQRSRLSSTDGLSGVTSEAPIVSHSRLGMALSDGAKGVVKRLRDHGKTHHEEEPKCNHTLPKVKGKEKRSAMLTIVVICVFVVAWSPYAVATLLGQFGPKNSVTPWLAMLPSLLAKSSTLYNPFLYLYKDTRFQRAFKRYVLRQPLPAGVATDSFTTQHQQQQQPLPADSGLHIQHID